MKTVISLLLTILAVRCPAQSQLVFNAGETLSYHFDTLPFIGQFVDIPGRGTSAGILTIDLQFGSMQAGDDFSVEMFEGAESSPAFFSTTFNNPGTLLDQRASYFIPGAWQDLNGTVRLIGLSGSVVFDDIFITTRLPVAGSPNLYDIYGGSVLVPEPSTLSLATMGCGALGLIMWRRKRGSSGR